MKIKLEDIKNIAFHYENCETDVVFSNNLLGVNIPRKTKSRHSREDRVSYSIKTFEFALQDNNNVLKETDIVLRTDLAQVTINYTNGDSDHFFAVWGKDDCTHDHSSLQKVHKKGNLMSITSNCESVFLN
jgi:hypothetical protein